MKRKTDAVKISRICEIETYDEPEGCDGIEVFAVSGLDSVWTNRLDLPEPNRLIVDLRFGVNEGWQLLYWRGGRYVIDDAPDSLEDRYAVKDAPGYVGVITGWYREEAKEKSSISIGGYEIEAERDKSGLLILTVKGKPRSRVIMVEHPRSGTYNTSEQLAFTDNAAIIAYELDGGETTDGRVDPKRLRRAAKDPAFRAWWNLNNKEGPSEYADRIDEMRRREAVPKKAGPKKIEAVVGGSRSRN